MKKKITIFLLSLFVCLAVNVSCAQQNIAKRKIGYETDGVNNYLIFKDSADNYIKTPVKGTGFLNFSPDSALFYYLEKKEGFPVKYDLIALDGNNTNRKITELNVNSKISVNNNGNVIVEPGQGDITQYLLGYNKQGEVVYYDSLKRGVWKSNWSNDGKYFACLFTSQEQTEANSTLKVQVFNSEIKEIFKYVFNDRHYLGSNFFNYQNDILSVYYYTWNENISNNPQKFVGKINLLNKKIERSETTW